MVEDQKLSIKTIGDVPAQPKVDKLADQISRNEMSKTAQFGGRGDGGIRGLIKAHKSAEIYNNDIQRDGGEISVRGDY